MNYSLREISKITGISYDTVKKYARKLNLRGKREKVSDEEIILLRKLGFSFQEIAKIKKVSPLTIQRRAKRLAKEEGRIEILGKGYCKKIRVQEKRKRYLQKLIDLLELRGGVVAFSEVPKIIGISSNLLLKIIKENPETFQTFTLYGRKGSKCRFRTSKFIKKEYVSKKFLALSTNRLGVIRFFMKIFKERLYDLNDIKAVNFWLRDFPLTEEERRAILISLGYKYAPQKKKRKFK